jgi:hypothetical protein
MFRTGQTNLAYELLESHLDSDIVGFAAAYRQLPASLRDQTSLKTLGEVRDYRAKYPIQPNSQLEANALADAFKLLDDK